MRAVVLYIKSVSSTKIAMCSVNKNEMKGNN